MDRVSRIFVRIHFLTELSGANVRLRTGLLRYITRGQMECIQIMASQILEGRILLLERDRNYFRRYRDLLRSLQSPNISFTRKKRLLLTFHTLVPRLLRRQYLNRAIANEVRAAEN